MKRKLNEEGVPSPPPSTATEAVEKPKAFDQFGFDSRLTSAIAQQSFDYPTDVQVKAIPLILAGKDVLARSQTGSGKTAAYVLPIIQLLLQRQTKGASASVLILVPTKELAQQITKVVISFIANCDRDIRVVNLTQNVPEPVQRSLLAEQVDIIVSTPSRAASNLTSGALKLAKLQQLVIDEADLVLSYGYEDDMKAIADALHDSVQNILMSATLSTEVETLKVLLKREPIMLDIKEKGGDTSGVSQFAVRCAEDEKFLLTYVVFKLKLIKGKSIIFVANTERCYRLKLFLEQFGIRSCVLNSELPVNTRIHVVEEFNKNVYDLIIAADENEVLGAEGSAVRQKRLNSKTDEDINMDDPADPAVEPSEADDKLAKKKAKRSKRSKEYGISRGIDFQNVACVLNFDLPTSTKSYTHRIGRTARAGKTGMALSFIVPKDQYRKHVPTTVATAEHDEANIAAITEHQIARGKDVKPYHFNMQQVNAFRYRMNDALRAVTGVAVRDARTREIRQELLKSEKLKRHFEENPEDLKFLRHDEELRTARVQPHLKHVPEYLMPLNGSKGMTKDVGFVGLRKIEGNRIRKAKLAKKNKGKGPGKARRKGDPLKSLGRGRR